MKTIVASRDEVEHGLIVMEPCVAISISDPEAGPAEVRLGSVCRDDLFLEFDDDEPIDGIELPSDVKLISAKDGKAIWRFVDRHRADVDTIVVNCHAGMSRSPAVAAAICEVLGEDSARFFREYMPNRYVYETVLAARNRAGPR